MKYQVGYCINLLGDERECFQTLEELIVWFGENAQLLKSYLQRAIIVITEEDFDESLWQELKR